MSDRNQTGVASWILLGLGCFSIMGMMAWVVGSHAIVFYTAPVFKAAGAVWKIIPTFIAGTAAMDVEVTYQVFRRSPGYVGFGDWLSFVNLCLSPYTYIFAVVAVWLFARQTKAVKSKRLTDRLGPAELAFSMMSVFSDIAPVVAIQEKLVARKLRAWKRQTFPEEFIKQLRYQGKRVLLPDPEAERTDGDRGLMLDESRLIGALRATKPYKHNGVTLRFSHHLGRQIVDLIQDTAAAKANSPVVHPDRLSDVGKAIFAILAPYAFGAKKGRDQSAQVKDALNYSAYGTPQGTANLSVPEVKKSFEQWRNHPLALKLARVHHWEYTYLYALLEQARRSGKIGTWSFIWLKPMNRVLYYVLNTCGRKTPHSEAALAFSQVQYERGVVKKGRLAITPSGEPYIFVDRVVKSLDEAWSSWRHGDDDLDNWWQVEEPADINTALLQDLAAMGAQPQLPPAEANI